MGSSSFFTWKLKTTLIFERYPVHYVTSRRLRSASVSALEVSNGFTLKKKTTRKKPLCPPPFIPFVPSLVQNQYSAVLTHNRFKYAIVQPIILLLFNHLMAFLYEWIQILVNEFLLYYFPKWLSFLFLDENVTEFVAGNITSMRPHAPLGAKRTNNDEYQINTENTPIGTGNSIRSFVIRLLE